MPPDDEAGLILFGANALVERPLSNLHELGQILSTPPTGNTDLEAAVRIGLLPDNAVVLPEQVQPARITQAFRHNGGVLDVRE